MQWIVNPIRFNFANEVKNALRLQHMQAAVYKDENFVNTGVDTRSEQEYPLVYVIAR